MNYISQIRAFYDALIDKSLTAGQISLWHALTDANNRCGWIEWFTVANIRLELSSGLSRQGIVKCRNELKQLGFIDFKSNGAGRAASYKVIKLYRDKPSATPSDSVHLSVQDTPTLSDNVHLGLHVGVQDGLHDGVQLSSALNKPETYKPETNNTTAVDRVREKQSSPFVDPEFGRAYSYITEHIAPTLSSTAVEELKHYCKTLGADLVILATDKNMEASVDKWSWGYIKAILRGFEKSKIKTVEEANLRDVQYRQEKYNRGNAAPPKPGSAAAAAANNSAPQREDLERMKKIREMMKNA